jgi:hypothetical protein
MDLLRLKGTVRLDDSLSTAHSNTVPRLSWSWHGTAALRVNGEMGGMEDVVYMLQKTCLR